MIFFKKINFIGASSTVYYSIFCKKKYLKFLVLERKINTTSLLNKDRADEILKELNSSLSEIGEKNE